MREIFFFFIFIVDFITVPIKKSFNLFNLFKNYSDINQNVHLWIRLNWSYLTSQNNEAKSLSCPCMLNSKTNLWPDWYRMFVYKRKYCLNYLFFIFLVIQSIGRWELRASVEWINTCMNASHWSHIQNNRLRLRWTFSTGLFIFRHWINQTAPVTCSLTYYICLGGRLALLNYWCSFSFSLF